MIRRSLLVNRKSLLELVAKQSTEVQSSLRSKYTLESVNQPIGGVDRVGLTNDSPQGGLRSKYSVGSVNPPISGSAGVGLTNDSPQGGLRSKYSFESVNPPIAVSAGVGITNDSPSAGVGVSPRNFSTLSLKYSAESVNPSTSGSTGATRTNDSLERNNRLSGVTYRNEMHLASRPFDTSRRSSRYDDDYRNRSSYRDRSNSNIRIKSCPQHLQERKDAEVDNKLNQISNDELMLIRDLLKNNSIAAIKAMVRSLRYEMKSQRLSEPSEEVDENANRSQNYRHPIGLHRNQRVASPDGDMEITFLGTASSVPNMTRGVSCTAFRYDSDMYLFDCGESSQLQFLYSDISTRKVNKIFITHLHGDHIFGLPPILCGLGSYYAGKIASKEMTQEELDTQMVVDIYGPEGIGNYIRSAFAASKAKIVAPYRIHELKNIPRLDPDGEVVPTVSRPSNANAFEGQFHFRYGERDGGTSIYPDKYGVYDVCSSTLKNVKDKKTGSVHVKAAPLSHTVPCVGYVIEEGNHTGTLRIDKVQPLIDENIKELHKIFGGAPLKVNRVLKNLQPDESYTFPNGRVVFGRDIVEDEIIGRKVVIMGDTCDSRHMVPIAMDADVVIHEATVVAETFEHSDVGHVDVEFMNKEAKKRGHSTPYMAGDFANQINAKQLLLTHFSSRMSGNHDFKSMKAMWQLEDLARDGAHKLVGKNDIIAAWDFMRLAIPTKNIGREYLEN